MDLSNRNLVTVKRVSVCMFGGTVSVCWGPQKRRPVNKVACSSSSVVVVVVGVVVNSEGGRGITNCF